MRFYYSAVGGSSRQLLLDNFKLSSLLSGRTRILIGEFVGRVVGQHGLGSKAFDACEIGAQLACGEYFSHVEDEPR